MKIFNSSMLILALLSNVAFAQTSLNYLPESQQLPIGIGGGLGGGYPGPGFGGNGGVNFSGAQGESIPIFDGGGSSQYRAVKVNAKCPLLTTTSKEDTDLFTDLKAFLSTASKSCSLAQNTNPNSMTTSQAPNISMMELMINGGSESSSPYGSQTGVSAASIKCYTQNVELIGQRNMAYYYVEKKMMPAPGGVNPFSECHALTDESMQPASKEKQQECIAKRYETLVEENKMVCKEINAPKAIQAQINKGLLGIESVLNQAIANKDECGFKSQDLFKVTMNTFLKAKALSVVGPWGAVAGFGADLVGNLLDKIFPSDAQKATALMDEILSEETFEQNACLYYNIQQKMYCEERPVEIAVMNQSCQTVTVSSDLLQLIQKYKDIKKVTDAYAPPKIPGVNSSPTFMGRMPAMAGAQNEGLSPEFESELLDHMDELSNHAIASEADLKERVKALPKIQQGREMMRIEKFIGKMREYQNYDAEKDPTGEAAKKLMSDIAGLFSENSWDISMFVVKTTSGTKLESMKQKSIARTIEELMASKDMVTSPNESSRAMARFNKYKNGVSMLAKSKFESRLEKQFKEFADQVKFVASRDRGVVNDSVAEGQLRNLVRHCSLLQEVYDPSLEGNMPKACQRLSCNNNKLNWFVPQANGANFSGFKQNYCDKSLSFQKTENEFIKELKNPAGAKICGMRAESFF